MEERQDKEFQEKVDDMFAPNGSPMSYAFKQGGPLKFDLKATSSASSVPS